MQLFYVLSVFFPLNIFLLTHIRFFSLGEIIPQKRRFIYFADLGGSSPSSVLRYCALLSVGVACVLSARTIDELLCGSSILARDEQIPTSHCACKNTSPLRIRKLFLDNS